MKEDFDLLPSNFRDESLSPREIVLPCDQALQAIALLQKQGVPLLGWEGWISYANGRKSFTENFQGSTEILPEANEELEAYVSRSAELCAASIREAQGRWSQNPEVPDGTLYFCLTLAR